MVQLHTDFEACGRRGYSTRSEHRAVGMVASSAIGTEYTFRTSWVRMQVMKMSI